ncbi:MAG: protein arginine kinase [Clostridia bacterium]|nr:protein arginine kinase [Clostridia bacterium]
MNNWYEISGPDNDVVLSTRIRLARNLDDIPFPIMMDDITAQQVIERCWQALDNGDQDFKLLRIKDLNDIHKQAYIEKHISSPDLMENPKRSALILKNDQETCVMVNEEDHIRIQSLMSGMQLQKAWKLADALDDQMEERLSYAFTEKLGYLTACPTNVGTGMRASVMVHLPALTMTNYIRGILHTVSKIGLAIRGLYGEGSDAFGNIYQISNQITIGQSEGEIINDLSVVTSQVIERERAARKVLMANKKYEFQDRLYRSYGVLANAKIMTSREFLELMSNVRMGVELGIIDKVDINTLNKLMYELQPANIQILAGKELNDRERDFYRASVLNEKLQ